ncbi:MAG: hypothetical protein ACYTEZ_11205 [Planctomycetota bacterium]
MYDEVREAYLDRLFATGEVRAAYQMGGVGTPGLSDLDLILVCRDPLRRDINAVADIRSLGEEARYVLMHGQFLVNEEIFRHQKALFFASRLRHLRGERLELHEPPAPIEEVLRLAFNVEMMLPRLAEFERIRHGAEVVAVRPLLAALHTLRFNVELSRAWTDVSDLEDYAAASARLREEWFELDEERAWARLEELRDRAVEVLAELLERLRPAVARLHPAAWSVQDAAVRALEIHEVLRYGPWPASVRVGRNPLRRALPASVRRSRPVRPHLAPVVEVSVPGEYFVFPYFQARVLRELGAPELARRVRGCLIGLSDPALEEAMRLRARLVVEMRRFAARNRLRRLSYLLPLAWQRPHPWQYRVKARVLEVLGVGA